VKEDPSVTEMKNKTKYSNTTNLDI